MSATCVFAIAITGLFNIFIDPLGVFGVPSIKSVNAIKPYLDHDRELSRFHRARRLCSTAGIFGNSRAEIGFDPAGPVLKEYGLDAFNHAIPGTGAGTAYRQLLWLQASKCMPKTVFLGIEFFDFLGGDAPVALPTLQSDPLPALNHRFFAETVFSIAGLRDSISTVLLQRSRYPATSTARGFNPILNYIPEVQQNGHYVLFRQRGEANIRSWKRKPLRLRPVNGNISDDEAKLAAILSRISQDGGTAYLIIYPYHAQIRVIMERLGMTRLFEDWKRTMVALAERSGNVQLWDFSGVSSETLEVIPEKGDRKTQLRYYWEAGHFKKELGELVMARMLGAKGDFGVKLDSTNIEQWLAEDRRRVQSLLEIPSPLTREVGDLIDRKSPR